MLPLRGEPEGMCPNSEFGCWNGIVEYSHAVMETVRVQAVNGYNAFGHGGLEVGGVLYGERRGEIVRIADSAPLECDHSLGPGFMLSKADEAALRDLVK